MQFHLNDLFVLDGVESRVSFINSHGEAYLTPLADGDSVYLKPSEANVSPESPTSHLLQGVVFAVLTTTGRDKKTGHKAITLTNTECGAV